MIITMPIIMMLDTLLPIIMVVLSMEPSHKEKTFNVNSLSVMFNFEVNIYNPLELYKCKKQNSANSSQMTF